MSSGSGAAELRMGSVNWEGLWARAKFVLRRRHHQKTSCWSLQAQRWRWARAEPPSGVKGAPFSRYSRCQFPTRKRRRPGEAVQELRRWPGENPKLRLPSRRTGYLGGSLLETSSYRRRTPSSGPGGVEVAGTYRSARMTGEPAAGAGPGEEEHPDGGSRVRRQSLPALPSRVWTSDSASPTAKRDCSARQLRNCLGLALTKPQA
jgi:hypothetical protein